MPKRTHQYEYEITKVLEDLRVQAGVEINDMAAYFGVGRDTVRDWELGYRSPHPTRRKDFIQYLLRKLRLRGNVAKFEQVWHDVMVEEWKWEELSAPEKWQYFPEKSRETRSAPTVPPPFLAPLPPTYGLVGRDDLLIEVKKRLVDPGRDRHRRLRQAEDQERTEHRPGRPPVFRGRGAALPVLRDRWLRPAWYA